MSILYKREYGTTLLQWITMRNTTLVLLSSRTLSYFVRLREMSQDTEVASPKKKIQFSIFFPS